MNGKAPSAFNEHGFKKAVESLIDEIQHVYLSDDIPWIVGYSGGKDSTAVLSLVWNAIAALPVDKRTKPIHVISTDTLVENPIVASWVAQSLVQMKQRADLEELPIQPNRLVPEVKDTFWVNLIGRGYPAPRPKFRWCTERLKIRPANTFVKNVVRASGQTIVVLGTRKAESAARSSRMERLESERVRDRLAPNESLPNSLVFSPIEDWSNDDVWLYLMQVPNPWGYDNKMLLNMYRGASADNECPLVVDTSTPSCGDSRFGCWVCTMVEQDKSMSAMIQNDHEKEWMRPLLELRNELDVPDDKHLRDFRRMDGRVQLFHDGTVPGPYTQASRENWLLKLLSAQTWVRNNGPEETKQIELITMEELHEIRRIWVVDKKEIEDSLPGIYELATGEPFPGASQQLNTSVELLRSLKEVCDDDQLRYEMVRDLIATEKRFATMSRRHGLLEELEKAVRRSFYRDRDDALDHARSKAELGQLDDSATDEDDVVTEKHEAAVTVRTNS